jgi:hypothetical protein
LGTGLLLLRFGGSRFTPASAIQSEYSELSESLVLESLEPARSSECAEESSPSPSLDDVQLGLRSKFSGF